MADQPKKPYVKLINREPQGTPYNYKDLCKSAALTEEQVESVVNNTSTTINNYITSGSGGVDPAHVIAGTSPVRINGAASDTLATDPTTISVNDATTTTKGIVELATDGEAASSVVVQGSDSRLGLGLLGTFWFGGGVHGAVTLVANTALSSGAWVRQYTTLDLAGYTLNQNTADNAIVVYVSGTLTLNGGTITNGMTATAGGAGGTGHIGNSPSGYGGAGGGTRGSVYVYARTISGTGTIHADGRNGDNGNSGTTTPGSGYNAGNGTGGTATSGYVYAVNITAQSTCGPGTGGAGNVESSANNGGAAGTGPQASTGHDHDMALLDVLTLLFSRAPWAANATSQRRHQGFNAAGGGGGAGCNDAVGVNSCAGQGGGGGGGGSGIFPGQSGGAGGRGGTSVKNTGGINGQSGGGGGGGSGGSVCVVVCISSSANLTVRAKGGNGGNGGNGGRAGGGTSNTSGGGGGGGGAGGIAVYIGPSGPSVTASGGSGGSGGTSGGGASGNGVVGGDGTAGRVYSMN